MVEGTLGDLEFQGTGFMSTLPTRNEPNDHTDSWRHKLIDLIIPPWSAQVEPKWLRIGDLP